jgi:hypothetical protein
MWRHPLKTVQHVFTSFCVIFTIVKAVTHFIPAIEIEGSRALGLAIWVIELPSFYDKTESAIRCSRGRTSVRYQRGMRDQPSPRQFTTCLRNLLGSKSTLEMLRRPS